MTRKNRTWFIYFFPPHVLNQHRSRAAAHRKNSGRQKQPLPFWDMVLLLKLLLASAFGFVLLAL
jgi:hypothetical protein